jgi:L-alanine-DL-glutamate epimerase-like enolase superfamily enzyme
MRITSVTGTPVAMPVAAPLYAGDAAGTSIEWGGRRSRISPRRPSPVIEYVIVRIETDSGLVGLGEAQADIGFFGETVEQVSFAVDDYLGPQLVGRDPADREHLMELIGYRGNSCAKSGIDLALHDLLGKALGVSVGTLIGGGHRRSVRVAVEIAGGTPDAMARRCLELMESGVRAFKAKIGGDPDRDCDRLRAIRDAVGPEVVLRADANQGYDVKQAIRLCRLCERHGVGLELLEQPVPAWDLRGMAAVSRAVDTLIEADESCFTTHDAVEIVRHEAADVLNIKLSKAGGLLGAKKIAAVAEGAGLRCVVGTAWGLGLEIAAKLHFASATPIVEETVEFTELSFHPNLLAPPHDLTLALPLSDGRLEAPDGPGLGVELDEAALARYRGAPRAGA